MLNTLIVTGALFVGSFFSYLLQFYLGRTLSVEGFGDFTVLLSVAGILTFFGNVIGYAVVKIYSELTAKATFSKIRWLFFKSLKYSALLGIFLGALCILLASVIATALNIQSSQTVVAFGLYLTLVFVPIYVAVYFQGTYRFVWFGFFIVLNAFLRFLLPIVFIKLVSSDPSYVFLGILLSQFLVILIGYVVANRVALKNVQSQADAGLLNNVFKNSIFNGLALFTLTVMISIDVIAVKYFFEPYVAGIYAGVVTLGKIVLFGAGTVATVMFPRAVSVNTDYYGFMSVFKKFGFIQVIFVMGSILIFSLFPSFITHTLFGEKFVSSIPYVAFYTAFISFYVLINFAILALIALGEKKFSLYMPLFLVFQLVGFYLFHKSIFQIIWVDIVSMLLLFVFMLFNIVVVFKRMKGQSTLNNAS